VGGCEGQGGRGSGEPGRKGGRKWWDGRTLGGGVSETDFRTSTCGRRAYKPKRALFESNQWTKAQYAQGKPKKETLTFDDVSPFRP